MQFTSIYYSLLSVIGVASVKEWFNILDWPKTSYGFISVTLYGKSRAKFFAN